MMGVLNSFKVKGGHCQYSLGIQSISKYCIQNGHEVQMVSTDPLFLDEGVEKILSLNPKIVGFSSNYVTEPFVTNMINILKQSMKKNIVIVVGGPSVTYSSRISSIRNSKADLFVRGDGEMVFCDILEKGPQPILEGKLKIKGVSSNGTYDESIASVELSSIPSIFPLKFQTDHVYWETVRGCVFDCIYCAHPGQKNLFREVPLEKILRDVEYLRENNFRAIYITDPILGGNTNRSKVILKLLKDLKEPFITAEYRPEYLDEEILDLLEEVKIGWLEFGLQTINPNLEYFRKNSDLTKHNLEKISRREIKYSLDLIAGIPGDTRDTFEDSLKFAIEDAKPTSLKIFPLRVYEGTILHKMAEGEENWSYDPQTRIIKSSHTFDEEEVSEWIRLGKTITFFYKFLNDKNWFENESKFRSLKFFIHLFNELGLQLPGEYDEKIMQFLWEKFKNEG